MGGKYSITLDLCSRTFQNRVSQTFLSSEHISLSSTNRSAGLHWEIPKKADATRFSGNTSKSGYICGGWLPEKRRRIICCASPRREEPHRIGKLSCTDHV